MDGDEEYLTLMEGSLLNFVYFYSTSVCVSLQASADLPIIQYEEERNDENKNNLSSVPVSQEKNNQRGIEQSVYYYRKSVSVWL